MFSVALLATLQSVPEATREREVVVTARPLDDTERSLRECVARRCPPDQEIAAALAHAENQFVAGRYKEARSTLIATIGDVRGRERDFPVQIGDLWRARSRIEGHLGETEQAIGAAGWSLAALKAGLPDDDPRVLGQQVGVGDTMVRMGRVEAGLRIYEAVAARARKFGQPVIEGHALLRIASVWTGLATRKGPIGPAMNEARARIAAVMRRRDPRLAPFRDAAELLSLKLDARKGDQRALDRLIARLRGGATERPLLIYAPPLDRDAWAGPRLEVIGANRVSAGGGFEKQWIDVGFRITPDGRVEDAEVLRGSEQLAGRWVEPVLAALRGRRYAPLKSVAAGSPGLMRVERITYTSGYIVPTGTRIRSRSGEPIIVVTDLTADPMPGG